MGKIDEKLRALWIAVDCTHSVNSVAQEHDRVGDDILRLLAELKLDLLDAKDAEEQRDALAV